MEPSLEWLPNELLDPILADLDVRDIARLTQCSKRLRGRLEAELYKDTGRISRATEWGSKSGNVDCLRAAARHGGGFDVFALSFAARKGRAEAFAFMLDHGARIEVVPTDDRTLRHQVWKLMRSLSQPGNFGMMRRFYEAGLDSQAREAGLCPQAVWPLHEVIRHGGPDVLERVQLVLDRGGIKLDGSWPNSGSLISLAITADSPDVVDFLVTHGVDIHGREGDKPRSVAQSRGWPCHVPVFAAAHEMARSEHGAAMMRLALVRHGADINQRTKVLHWPRQGYWEQTDYYCTTPLFVFLDSVRSWKDGSGPDVIEGLKFLIGHGALFRLPDMKEPRDVVPPYTYTRPPLPINLLLGRWGLQTLNRSRFLAVIRFLVKHGLDGAGLSPEEVATIVAQDAGTQILTVESPAVLKGRRLLLDVLLEGRTVLESTKVLNWLLVKTGQTGDKLRTRYGQALDSLAAAGATTDHDRVSDDSLRSKEGVKSLVIRGKPAS